MSVLIDRLRAVCNDLAQEAADALERMAELEADNKRLRQVQGDGADDETIRRMLALEEAGRELMDVYKPPDFAPGPLLRAWKKLEALL